MQQSGPTWNEWGHCCLALMVPPALMVEEGCELRVQATAHCLTQIMAVTDWDLDPFPVGRQALPVAQVAQVEGSMGMVVVVEVCAHRNRCSQCQGGTG